MWEIPADDIWLQPVLPTNIVLGGSYILCNRQLQAAVVSQGEIVLHTEAQVEEQAGRKV